MWTTAPGSRPRRLHTFWRPAVTLAVAAWVLVAGAPGPGFEGALLIGVFLSVGLPHGAHDHVVAERKFGIRPLTLYAAYLFAAAVLFAVWLLIPPVVALVFMGLAAWHFGEGDLRGLHPRRGLGPALILSRGWMILGSLAWAWPDRGLEVLGAWAPPAPTESTWWIAVVAVPHLALLLLALDEPLRVRLRDATDATVLLLWLWCAPPLLAFAHYFGMWHSWDHLVHLRESLREGPRRWTWAALLGRGFPNALASALGILVLTLVGTTVMEGAALWGLALGGLAAVATPHLVLVEVWRRRSQPAPMGGPRAVPGRPG